MLAQNRAEVSLPRHGWKRQWHHKLMAGETPAPRILLDFSQPSSDDSAGLMLRNILGAQDAPCTRFFWTQYRIS